MAENTSNYDQLVNAGVIPANADLSGQELEVINGLSPEEVDTLVSIRQNLHKAEAASRGMKPEDLPLSASKMNANFIV